MQQNNLQHAFLADLDKRLWSAADDRIISLTNTDG
ncbi:hypothetical protein RP300_01843 [Oligella urethralis]|uniref:Uncharacterized protein n=1 Tax=Oligella urethralis TaxID=90245 RepID=A0A2X1UJ89_9BURK|nr:hypothetical protein RP300_01843 [Oligella urethralis]SPY07286.1 Uncharacterised protein [Oligella urethralis]SUA64831.1 Uncharacterised protein [Oligella urethralis]SUA66293.1 Uncharacterised protein [Oligella urethralis]SUA94420.1 Uncharacterised protein [Oligella urethralis]